MKKTIWFTADWHLFHENIIKYTNRPFKNRYHMNKVIIDKYCNCVKDDDEVYFLGDLTMLGGPQIDVIKPLIEPLPGHKHIILGNHDRFRPFSYHEIGFESVHTALKLDFYKKSLYLAHDPAWAQIPNTVWICGHIHGLFKHMKSENSTTIINCGIDVWDFNPVPLNKVKEIVKSYE